MVDICRDVKHRDIYLTLGFDPGEDSYFSIYQNNEIKITLYSKRQYNVNLFSIFSTRASCHFDFRLKINK